MKTAVAETSIACYYEKVTPSLAASQNERTMFVVDAGRDYSLSELMALTNTASNRAAGLPDIDKSCMARVVNGLRAAGRLEAVPEKLQRKCTVTGVTVTPSRLPSKQGELL
jgi:hypothetical protein